MVIRIEHYEFNSSLQKRDGSLFRKESSKAKRNHKKREEIVLENKGTIITNSKLKMKNSIKNYFDNFKYGYLKHKLKVENYKEFIKKEFDCSKKTVKMGFLIEDNSPVGG